MTFNSISFLLFFAAVLFLHTRPISWRAKKVNLLLLSYLFYACWDPLFVGLILFSTITDWSAARWIARAGVHGRRIYLLISIAINLTLLGYFKYAEFVAHAYASLVAPLGVNYQAPTLDIVLPLGISFYTFQSMSYSIDVFRGRLRPSRSLIDFALFVSFFPQLVSGPIVRAGYFLNQCLTTRKPDRDALGWGLSLALVGLFEKVVLADAFLAPVVDKVYGAVNDSTMADAWIGTLAFSGQIFFDFNGYSLIAIGVAMCLGFSLPDNFRFPYGAIGFSDFWQRWHISLSAWLRDYLYIAMGGNRRGSLRTGFNLSVTMLLGGLWHGAAWTFVAWGAVHGMFLLVEHGCRSMFSDSLAMRSKLWRVSLGLITFAAVTLSWVLFRAESFADAGNLFVTMFSGWSPVSQVVGADVAVVAIVMSGLLLAHCALRAQTLEHAVRGLSDGCRAVLLGLMLIAVITVPRDDRAFIYFQF